MKKLLAGAGLVVLTLLSACTLPLHVILTNASKQTITVAYVEGAGQSHRVALNPAASTEIGSLLDLAFSIQANDAISAYRGVMIPEQLVDYVGFGPFTKRVVNVRYADDGCVYLAVLENGRWIKKPDQPAKFPLCPWRADQPRSDS
jgi:hypothetical protein